MNVEGFANMILWDWHGADLGEWPFFFPFYVFGKIGVWMSWPV
jgi:hypothetical protein